MGYHSVPDGDPVVLYEILHGVEPVEQPVPGMVPGGDCFQCAAYAILRHLAGSEGLPVTLREMYDRVWSHPDVGMARGGSQVARKPAFWLRWNELLGWWGLRVETVEDPPLDLWAGTLAHTTFGPRMYTTAALVRRVRTYLEAGYLVYAEMQRQGSREIVRSGYRPHGADHVVVVDGYRRTYRRSIGCDGSGSVWGGEYGDEIHVVCSVVGTYWISVSEWVEDHGGYDMRFVRRRREADSPPWPEEPPRCPEHG